MPNLIRWVRDFLGLRPKERSLWGLKTYYEQDDDVVTRPRTSTTTTTTSTTSTTTTLPYVRHGGEVMNSRWSDHLRRAEIHRERARRQVEDAQRRGEQQLEHGMARLDRGMQQLDRTMEEMDRNFARIFGDDSVPYGGGGAVFVNPAQIEIRSESDPIHDPHEGLRGIRADEIIEELLNPYDEVPEPLTRSGEHNPFLSSYTTATSGYGGTLTLDGLERFYEEVVGILPDETPRSTDPKEINKMLDKLTKEMEADQIPSHKDQTYIPV